MANIPDLMTLLCLDAKMSISPFGGQHRTIVISIDYTNSSDFVFNNFLQHYARKEPNTPILLVTLSHDWTNYSASAAKCGYNLRRTQNNGNIEVLNAMSTFLDSVKAGDQSFDPCDYISKGVTSFIDKNTLDAHTKKEQEELVKPIIVMIDDISLLLSLNSSANKIYQLFSSIDKSLRDRSNGSMDGGLSHFIVQTMVERHKSPSKLQYRENCDLNYLVANMENQSDLSLSLKPLETGYSTRVDGTIKIVDNRLPKQGISSGHQIPSIATLMLESAGEIGMNKAFFFKQGDRRVRLTSSALIL